MLLVIFFSTLLTSIFQVSGSLSTKTGTAPHLITGSIQEIIVNEGRITSSFFFIFKDSKANCKAAVPLLTDIANFLFTLLANLFSKFFTKGPPDEIKPSLIHFFKYYCTSSNHPIHPLEFLVPLMHPPDLISSPPCLDFESQSK